MWRNFLCCALALVFLSASALAADDIKVEKVIGTEKPGAYKHPAAITELDNGDLYITFYGGGGEYEEESKVYGIRRSPGQTVWSEPQLLADTPFQGEGNGIVWQAPDGLVWLFYVQRFGATWSESLIKAKISEDGGHTWSDSMNLGFEMGTMAILTTRPTQEFAEDINGDGAIGIPDFNLMRPRIGTVSEDITGN